MKPQRIATVVAGLFLTSSLLACGAMKQATKETTAALKESLKDPKWEKQEYEPDYGDGPVAGEINEVKWKYTVASATYRPEGQVFFQLYTSGTTDPCGPSPRTNYVMFTRSAEPGQSLLKLMGPMATLVEFTDDKPVNHLAAKGGTEILEVTDTVIKGRVDIVGGAEDWVKGSFTAKICGDSGNNTGATEEEAKGSESDDGGGMKRPESDDGGGMKRPE